MDREGNTWMASDGNGIVKMPRTNVQILGNLRPGIKNNITAMFQDADTTWVFNKTDHSFYRIHSNQLTPFPLTTPSHYVGNIFILKGSLYFIAEEILLPPTISVKELDSLGVLK